MVSNIFYFHPYLGKIPILTNIFQMGWNHHLASQFGIVTKITFPYRSSASLERDSMCWSNSQQIVQVNHPGPYNVTQEGAPVGLKLQLGFKALVLTKSELRLLNSVGLWRVLHPYTYTNEPGVPSQEFLWTMRCRTPKNNVRVRSQLAAGFYWDDAWNGANSARW